MLKVHKDEPFFIQSAKMTNFKGLTSQEKLFIAESFSLLVVLYLELNSRKNEKHLPSSFLVKRKYLRKT